MEPAKAISVNPVASDPLAWNGDLLVVGVYEECVKSEKDKPVIANDVLKSMDAALDGALADIIALHDFKGKKGSSQVVRVGKSAKFVALCGLGPEAKATPISDWGNSVYQGLGACVATSAKACKAKSAGVTLVGGSGQLDAVAAEKIANGVLGGGYESTRFKSKPGGSPLESVDLLMGSGGNPAGVQERVNRGLMLARGALLTRYLVESPPNVATPSYLAHAAQRIAEGAPDVMQLEVLERDQCEALGMGCFLGVAEASAEPPKFIHLTYTPKGPVKKKVAIIGKGLTFDSGGYNIKAGPGSMIELMKFDMGGSGATLGAAQAISQIKPDGVEIHFIVASCENMVDGRGLRPGDILVASNGKTVEIINTDAEGRLTLADALLFAQNQCGAEAIVDIATLTGACMIALGNQIAAMYSTDEAMAQQLQEAAKNSGERLWRMPLEDGYSEELKSAVADLKNVGGRFGGSITAGLFLREFVATDKVSWAHIDMAGPVWDEKQGGATGYGAQLLAEWAIAQGK